MAGFDMFSPSFGFVFSCTLQGPTVFFFLLLHFFLVLANYSLGTLLYSLFCPGNYCIVRHKSTYLSKFSMTQFSQSKNSRASLYRGSTVSKGCEGGVICVTFFLIKEESFDF